MTMIRKKHFILGALTMFLSIGLLNASVNPTETKTPAVPDNVKAIVDKSCFGCHNTDSKNDKAKEKLDLKTFDALGKKEMIHALGEIAETVEENEMPPAKFLEKFPDKKLTDAEKKILIDWANNEGKALMKK
jgi:mono/diheme cytochrome c family protein